MNRRDVIALLGGAAVACPLTASAQQAIPVVGALFGGMPAISTNGETALRLGLKETGFTVGQNVALEIRYAESHADRLPALAAELVQRKVSVIVAVTSPAAQAAKKATATIPIAFNIGNDPVASGLVASLSHPGGNLTGTTVLSVELEAKLLDILHELLPTATAIGALMSSHPDAQPFDIGKTARALGLTLMEVTAGTAEEIDAAFARLEARHAEALLVGSNTLFLFQRDKVASLAAQHRLPAIYGYREDVLAGGLISYGASIPDALRQTGVLAGRILKGEKPADLPVMQPTKFELLINMKAAKALGLTVPPTLIARADEVLE